MSTEQNEFELNQPAETRRFYALVWPHRAAVLRVARLLAVNEADADDLAQDTLVKAFKAMPSFQDNTNVRAWLMTILRNTRIDRLRVHSASSESVSLDTLAVEPVDTHADLIAEQSWNSPEDLLNAFSDEEVIGALRCLPEDMRWTLLLVDVEGLEHHEAATVLGVPVGTIKSRTHRGRALLKQALLPMARDRHLVRD